MNPKAKKFLSNFFFGLFSNDHAIEGSKSNPWWVGLIILVLGVFLPVIPLTVNAANSYGASFLTSYTYRYDQNIADLTTKLLLDNKEFKVNDNHELQYFVDGEVAHPTVEADVTPVAAHINATTNQYELVIYFTEREGLDLDALKTSITDTHYKSGSTSVAVEGDTAYAPSYVILYKNGIYTKLMKENSTEAGSNTSTTYATDWKHFDVGHELLKNTLPEGKTAAQVDLNSSKDVQEIFANWKEVYNKAYLSQKTYNTWFTTLLFYGIYLALAIFMGLLVFLLTRGKNNMFNYLKFWDCQKIVWWASLCPAILAMIVGFIFSNFAQMIFIILFGLRIMWISMKQLRPQY